MKMNKLKWITLSITLMLQSIVTAGDTLANSNNSVSDTTKEMLRGNAKFNVVAAILILIFVGIVLYLIRLDKKMLKLEKQINQK